MAAIIFVICWRCGAEIILTDLFISATGHVRQTFCCDKCQWVYRLGNQLDMKEINKSEPDNAAEPNSSDYGP